jgi:hypothetical protein
MALAKQKSRLRQIRAAQNGYTEVNGIAQFNAQDASGELNCLLQNVEDFVAFPIGPVAADESIYLDEAAQVNADSLMISRPASKTVTVTRTGAAKTAGLYFAFRYRGYLLLIGILLAGLFGGGCSEYATVRDAKTGDTVYGPAPVVRDAAGVAHDAKTGTTLPAANPATGNGVTTTTDKQLDPDKVEQVGGAVVGVAADAATVAGGPTLGDAVKVLGGAGVVLLGNYLRSRRKRPPPAGGRQTPTAAIVTDPLAPPQ